MSIYSYDPYSWLEYGKSLSEDKDIYASFIIIYVALSVYCNDKGLYSFSDGGSLVEVDTTKIERRYLPNYVKLKRSSSLRTAIDDWMKFFSNPQNDYLKYPTYPGSREVRDLRYDRRWKELGNAINYARVVRNNLVHGGKNYDADAQSRDYKVVKLAKNIILGLFEDLFERQ